MPRVFLARLACAFAVVPAIGYGLGLAIAVLGGEIPQVLRGAGTQWVIVMCAGVAALLYLFVGTGTSTRRWVPIAVVMLFGCGLLAAGLSISRIAHADPNIGAGILQLAGAATLSATSVTAFWFTWADNENRKARHP